MRSQILAPGDQPTSSNANAPLQIYVTQQNDPLDNSIAMRVELKNKRTQSVALSAYRVMYFFSDPYIDPAWLTWDTYYNSGTSPIRAEVRRFYLGRTLGPRAADTALEFTFPIGATLAAGASLVFQGNLHRDDWSWYPDENDDWSRYLKRDGMAEGAVIQEISTGSIVFGSSPEFPPGANQLAVTPSQVAEQATISYLVTDPSSLNTMLTLEVHNETGVGLIWLYEYIGTLGARTVALSMSGQKPGRYTLVLKNNAGAPIDAVTFTKL